MNTASQSEGWSHSTFTYSQAQITQLVSCYRSNPNRLSAALICALGSIFDANDWLPVLELLEKIQVIDHFGPNNIAPDDYARQWMALALDPKLNPEWLVSDSSVNPYGTAPYGAAGTAGQWILFKREAPASKPE